MSIYGDRRLLPVARYLAANLAFGIVGFHAASMLNAWYVAGLDRIVWALVIKPVLGLAPWFLVGIGVGWVAGRRRRKR